MPDHTNPTNVLPAPRWVKRAVFVNAYRQTASPRTWDRLIASSQIKAVKQGSNTLIDLQSVEAYLNSLPAVAAG